MNQIRTRPWNSDKGSSSCLPKEARIEYERQEKSIAGNLPYLSTISIRRSSCQHEFPGYYNYEFLGDRFHNYSEVKNNQKIIWIYFMDLASLFSILTSLNISSLIMGIHSVDFIILIIFEHIRSVQGE